MDTNVSTSSAIAPNSFYVNNGTNAASDDRMITTVNQASNNNILQQQMSHDNNQTLSPHYQVENSTGYDLDTIITLYDGLMRINRLVYIADHCPSLRYDALCAALKYIQDTHFITMYRTVHNNLNEMVQASKRQPIQHPTLTIPELDAQWLERTQRNYLHKLEKLDTDLRNFRTNSIKDSIRRGHDDLGDHYLDGGDYFNAVRCYVRSRDYCVTPRHMVTMCMNVIKASFYLQNWPNVLTYVSKAEQAIENSELSSSNNTKLAQFSATIAMDTSTTPSTSSTQDQILTSKLKVYAGIAELSTKRYKLAARHFISVNFEHCQNNCHDLISPQTLIQYVCLCSLATFERHEIQRLILNSNIKQYLELEPNIRDIIQKFYDTNYSDCLKLMTQYQSLFYLDIYLAQHVKPLYHDIRHRIIVTYFLPYKNASMLIMAKQLNTTIDSLEDELVNLIRNGKIKARIDSKNKILYVADTDQRWYAYQHALNIAKECEKTTKSLLLRSAILKANLVVRDETTFTGAHIHHQMSTTNNNNNNDHSASHDFHTLQVLRKNVRNYEDDMSDDATV
ncbi:unnamed protein product [Didymodactylos carnosus]|uniref:PCI domain-containing protein n=1 Tax=Didymodactylos carnosus TaxID=1234261 RepID=A0A814F192_9BILA|nr:unnamed protein product [Didymodactylos carnosus]CAF0976737.1 unnamed protein product [Didymodactylos carnosus]CAF3571540.1 unnamed protein product [Didymodactylos carnosus]CAF3749581.1 unnamed protein product [Didymodactylos carnosus]